MARWSRVDYLTMTFIARIKTIFGLITLYSPNPPKHPFLPSGEAKFGRVKKLKSAS